MIRAEEQRWVKSDKNKEYGYIGVRGAKNAGYDDEGEKQTVLKKEGDGKLPAGSFSRNKHRDQTQYQGNSRKYQPP
jgi:hypothetical protein